MQTVNLSERRERETFALKAAEWFSKNPEGTTYTSGDIVPDCLFAVRWGLGKDCVVVFRLHEYEAIENYENVIPKCPK